MKSNIRKTTPSKSLLIILIIIPLILLLVQTKINKSTSSFENSFSDVSSNDISHNNAEYVSSRKRKMMLQPVVKLSILDYNSPIRGIQSSEGTLSGTATGVSVGYNKKQDITYILSNYHFCEDVLNEDFKMILIEDSSAPRIEGAFDDSSIGVPIKVSQELDLCLISTTGYIPPARIANKNIKINQFDEIYIIGGPTGIFPTILDTYISGRMSREDVSLEGLAKDGNEFVFISGIILPGHSGSPVYNKNYELIGLVFATIPSYGALAIPIEDIRKFLNN